MQRAVLIPLIVACALFMENMDSTVIATSLPAIALDIGESPLALAGDRAEVSVENAGPPLPEAMRGKLFESMVSVRGERGRDAKSAEPHLGLGLYVARLIAEFHGGAISARNLASGGGVAVTASFRLA